MCTLFVVPLMSLLVLLCFLVTDLIAFCSTHATNELRYDGLKKKQFNFNSGIEWNFLKKIRHQSMHQTAECGPHGKFEYCIDGIPGCVVGCHCHPGYYFDTDTKICELNVKLTQDFRRHYAPEPSRLYEPPAIIHGTDVTVSTLSPTNNNADKIDEIPKDTDELGDWLYNQFFKTIESQVINKSNNTKPETKEKAPTRRSGGNNAPAIKSRRKARKSMRSSRRKKHMKGHGLRRKLLRITEDDSLFDSDSDSDSSGSSSGSEDDSESSSGSAESKESEGNGKKPSNDKDDKDHGHKKVIIFNRRPKPPLPSFIFLPSMDTPFYPPIGLPPPPPMPMYPMVPVPPMFPPFPVPPPCEEGGSGASEATSPSTPPGGASEASTPVTPPNGAAAPADESPTTVTTTTVSETPPASRLRKSDRRSRFEKRLRKPMPEDFIAPAGEHGKQKNLKHEQRKNLMHKLQEQMRKNNRKQINTSDAQMDNLEDVGSVNEEDIPDLPDAFPHHKRSKHKPEEPKMPKLEDVDFTYLSQLIHRVNESQTKNKLPSMPLDLNKDLKELQRIQAQQTRRTFDSYNLPPINDHPEVNQHRNLHKPGSDDIYYTNLGRKIAAMIRNADFKLNSQFKEESEHHQLPYHSVLNENSQMPQAYWERSVRSPLKQLRPFSNYLEEARTLRHSNERNLLNLENEVKTFASTPEPLSLQDLENILNTMQKVHAHIKLRQPSTNAKRSEVSMNVNLLPNYIKPENSYRRILNEPKKVEYFPISTTSTPKVYAKTHAPNITNLTVFHKEESNYNSQFHDYWMYSGNQQAVKPIPISVSTSKPLLHKTQSHPHSHPDLHPHVQNPIRPLSVSAVLPQNPSPTKVPRTEHLAFLRSMPIVKQTAPKRYEPILGNNHNLNYFTGNKHHYMFEQGLYPLLTPFRRQIRRNYRHPSFFHPSLHHFEFFD
ncbi:hypothetical protein B5X24_HaOG217086 [Helicoverpa armigera]|uniref:Chitin-binding type-2 domain-containing protein n=1 Tax=Helicoverpa armigera TaxID=29058 RepID=A0A2W1BUY2_HELAM|nr:hypothetical protein B5X24_HaOG217086 [Helicoverpa armigera]